MSNTEQKNVLITITEKYDEIFKAEKKVADFILKNPEVAVNANVSELANYSGVSDATVIRLCKHLGYSGYYQMKICLSRDMGSRDSGRKKKNQSEDASVESYFRALGETITEIGTLASDQTFRDVVKLFRESERIYIIAQGNTAPLAMYMSFRLERLGLRASANLQPEYFMNHINLASEKECMLVISWSGMSKNLVKAMELAKERGMKCAVVTGYQYSPMTRLADYLLLSSDSGSNLEEYSQLSRINEMAVLEALLYMLSDEMTEDDNENNRAEMLLANDKY